MMFAIAYIEDVHAFVRTVETCTVFSVFGLLPFRVKFPIYLQRDDGMLVSRCSDAKVLHLAKRIAECLKFTLILRCQVSIVI